MSSCLKYLGLCCVVFALGCGSKSESTVEPSDETTEITSTDNKPGENNVKKVTAQLLENAGKFLQNKQPQKAAELASQAIAISPESTDAHIMRANSHAQSGRMADALADYSAAIRLQPTNPRFHNARGVFLMSRLDFQSAFNDLNKAIELDENIAGPFNNRGLLLILAGKYETAITDLTRALKISPQSLDALNNRGFAYLKLGKNEKAIADFDLALKQNSEYINPYDNRGQAYLQLKKYKKAAVDFGEAIKRDPNNRKYYEHRIVAWRLLGDKDKAIQDANKLFVLNRLAQLNRGIIANPRAPERYLDRARFYYNQNDVVAASRDIVLALALDAKNANVYLLRAEIHIAQKSWFDALQDVSKSIQMEPSDKAYSMRGDIHFHNKNYDRAIQDFEHSRRFDTTVALAYFRHSQELKEKGKVEEANSARRRALAIDPQIANFSGSKTNGN